MEQPWPFIISAVLGLAGIALLWYGFDRMKKYRLIKDIPRSKVRSMAMGVVEVHGSVFCEEPMKTPFSSSDCVYYKYEIKEYRRHTSRDSKGKTRTTYRWDTIATGQKHIPFFAKDDTGQVYVNPYEAEFSVDVKKAFLQKAGIFGGISSFINFIKNWDKNDEPLLDTSDLNLIPIENPKSFNISYGSNVGDRKYYEYYLEPDENLFVIGTAAHYSSAPEEVLIRKGDNQPIFIISNKSEKELLKSLKWKMIGSFAFGSVLFAGAVFLLFHFQGII